MKVLLIDPPMQSIMLARADWFPMGLGFLAGSAKREGHEVLIYNGEHDPSLDYVNLTTYSSNYHRYLEALRNPDDNAWKRLRKVMTDFKPDVVGLTSFSVKWPSAQRVAALAKDCNPGVPVVAGGQHVTIMTDDALADPNIDFVVKGEGEMTFVEFLREVEGAQNWAAVDGLSWKRDGKVVHNKPRMLTDDLDALPGPARECLYDIENYQPQALGKLFASRGCPYQCNYCGTQNIWTYKVRHRSAQHIVDEIKQVKKDYGTNYFTFFDDVFGLDKKRAIELCNTMADAKLGVRWDCLTRSNLVSDELLISMKRAGCVKVDMGVESGSNKILKDTKKGLTTEQILTGGELIKKHGLFLYAFFMVGLPTETEEDAKMTIEFLEKLKPHWAGISIFTPIPGTGIYKQLQAEGKIADKPDFAMFSHQSPHSNFAFNMMNREAFPELSRRTLEYIQNYNGSYRNLFRRGLSRGYHKDPRLLASDLRKVMTWKNWLQSSHQGSHSRFYSKPDRPMIERE
jgi:anaerobic magnesium-protoporphyrin IX monomethyl ester cyclase